MDVAMTLPKADPSAASAPLCRCEAVPAAPQETEDAQGAEEPEITKKAEGAEKAGQSG